MNSSMTIGQYFPGNSPVHRMDARMKIVLTFLMVVAVFLCKNFWSLGLAIAFMILAVGLSKIPPKTILKSIKPLVVIILITGVINLFYGEGEPLVSLGKLKITMDGVMTAVFMAVRIIELVIVGSLLTYTTSPTELTDALERLLKPLKVFKIDVHVIAMTMTIARGNRQNYGGAEISGRRYGERGTDSQSQRIGAHLDSFVHLLFSPRQ